MPEVNWCEKQEEEGGELLSLLWTNALLDKCLAKDSSRNMRALFFGRKEGGTWEGRENYITSSFGIVLCDDLSLSLGVCSLFIVHSFHYL